MPLHYYFPNAVANMMPASNGQPSSDVVHRFDQANDNFFYKLIRLIIDLDFETIVLHLKSVSPIRLSHLLHLLKCARTRILNYLLMIDIEELKCINTILFAEEIKFDPVFTDKNSSAAMKDDYDFTFSMVFIN